MTESEGEFPVGFTLTIHYKEADIVIKQVGNEVGYNCMVRAPLDPSKINELMQGAILNLTAIKESFTKTILNKENT